MSSFKKNNKSKQPPILTPSDNDSRLQVVPIVRAEGVKPWINCGLGLVSSGNKQLDDTIGRLNLNRLCKK